ncbi:MAG: hypothetical protein GC165_12785 [Armatimonadetes bacterium]|nr:hypothetical protein [Armatimonadota bacterium]MBS1726042.1 hypothetical protein [Armatimonadota bacterium]
MRKTYIYLLSEFPIKLGIHDGECLKLKEAPPLTTAPGALILAMLAKGKADRRFLERAFFSRTIGINENGVAKLAQRTGELMRQYFGPGKWVRQSQLDIFFEGGQHYCDVINGPYSDSVTRLGLERVERLKAARNNLDSFSSSYGWIKEYKRWLCMIGDETELIYGESEQCKVAREKMLASIESQTNKRSDHSQQDDMTLLAFVDIDGTSNILNRIDSPIMLDRALERASKVIESRLQKTIPQYCHKVITVQRWGYDAFSILIASKQLVRIGLFVSIVEAAIVETINEFTESWVNVSFGLHSLSGATAAQELAASIFGCRESKKRKRLYTVTKPLHASSIGWAEVQHTTNGVEQTLGSTFSDTVPVLSHDLPVTRTNTSGRLPGDIKVPNESNDEPNHESIDLENLAWMHELKFQSDSLFRESAYETYPRRLAGDTTNFYISTIPFETRRLSEGDAKTFVRESSS